MPETMRNKTVAYNKGAMAQKTGEPCPYGRLKMELYAWWHAGVVDAANHDFDQSMCYDKTLAAHGIRRGETK